MVDLRRLMGPRLHFGDGSGAWPARLRRRVWACALVAPLFVIAGVDFEELPLLSERLGWVTVLVFGMSLALGGLGLVAWGLTLRRRAVGLFLVLLLLTYVGPMTGALAIAVAGVTSGLVLLGTCAVAVWSLWGIWQINARVQPEALARLAAVYVRLEGGLSVLQPSQAIDRGETLAQVQEGLRPRWVWWLEYGGALAILVCALALMPRSGAQSMFREDQFQVVLWLVFTGIFLVSRRLVSSWILLLRAASAHAAPQDAP